MKFLLVGLLAAISINGSSQSSSFTKVKATDNITLKMPDNLIRMPENEVRLKYISERAPLAAFTDMTSHSIDFLINESITQWREQDLDLMKGFFRSSILNLYDAVKMMDEGTVTIGKKRFAYFEFISTVKGDQNSIKQSAAMTKYSYLYYTIHDGHTLLFSLTTPSKVQNQWKGMMPKIMETVKVK